MKRLNKTHGRKKTRRMPYRTRTFSRNTYHLLYFFIGLSAISLTHLEQAHPSEPLHGMAPNLRSASSTISTNYTILETSPTQEGGVRIDKLYNHQWTQAPPSRSARNDTIVHNSATPAAHRSTTETCQPMHTTTFSPPPRPQQAPPPKLPAPHATAERMEPLGDSKNSKKAHLVPHDTPTATVFCTIFPCALFTSPCCPLSTFQC